MAGALIASLQRIALSRCASTSSIRPAQLASIQRRFHQPRCYSETTAANSAAAECGAAADSAAADSTAPAAPAASSPPEAPPALQAAQPQEKRTGVVKSFNRLKGFGFILPDDHGPDVFVHHSAIVTDADFRTLVAGEEVEFSIQIDEAGLRKASAVTGPGGAPVKGGPGLQGGFTSAPPGFYNTSRLPGMPVPPPASQKRAKLTGKPPDEPPPDGAPAAALDT